MLIGYVIFTTGNGLLCLLISLRLTQQPASQMSPMLAGVVQSAYYVGFALGALSGGSLVTHIGHQRACIAFAAIPACCALAFPIWDAAWLWGALRVVTGFCLMGTCTAVESWLHHVASNAQRCRMFSTYMILNYLGLGAGQFLAVLGNPSSFELFCIVSMLFTASLLPVALANVTYAHLGTHDAHNREYHSHCRRGIAGLVTVYRGAPLGLVACLAVGLLNGAFCSMQPVFMRHLNYSVADVSRFMGFSLLVALVPQWPVARLADKYDRRKVLLCLAMLASSLGLLLSRVQGSALIQACGYLYVASAFSMYGVIVSYVNDHTPASQRVAVSAGLLLIFSLGASGGSTLASAAMAIAGPGSLYSVLALIAGGLATWTLCCLIWEKYR
ncbi:MFS transporter [Ralstonia psammae]|uniref:MFS transporter n=1 Tax=Ralstonia psammae TaxID=3058598 RepID=UPI00292E7FA2|nr:MFS transporter [Ralstonia sp. LMG 19083]